ncbi:MAG: 6-phosphogluconolactonase, partial [Paludibacter sp.]
MRTNLSSQITLMRVPKRYFQPEDVFELSRVTRYEKINTEIFDNEREAALNVALEIAALIKEKQAANEKCILGLTNGKSTFGIYTELIRLYKEGNLSFSNVVVFNLFEYYPLKISTQGCFLQMKDMLFDHIDIPAENIFSPDATLDKSEIMSACAAYEEKIAEYGGIDFQILGIGRSGNIGFNEPGSQSNSRTRLILLDNISRKDASDLFGGIDAVPISAMTMGVGTILKAKRI